MADLFFLPEKWSAIVDRRPPSSVTCQAFQLHPTWQRQVFGVKYWLLGFANSITEADDARRPTIPTAT